MLYVIDESSFLVKTIPSYYSSLMLGTAINNVFSSIVVYVFSWLVCQGTAVGLPHHEHPQKIQGQAPKNRPK